jgi:hypothetical protein
MPEDQNNPPRFTPPDSVPPGNVPPYVPAYASNLYEQPRPRTSGTAIASLVLGIFGCIPFVTGIAAVVLGIIGIRVTRSPALTRIMHQRSFFVEYGCGRR